VVRRRAVDERDELARIVAGGDGDLSVPASRGDGGPGRRTGTPLDADGHPGVDELSIERTYVPVDWRSDAGPVSRDLVGGRS
jgi:hypothetical protein